jgi:hypothetical protein
MQTWMVFEMGQILEHFSLGRFQEPIAQPITSTSPYFFAYKFVGHRVELLGIGLVDNEVEGATVLVPASLPFRHGSFALSAHFDLICQTAMSLPKDARYSPRTSPAENASDEFLGDRQHGE